MLFNLPMLLCVIGAPPEPAANKSDTDPILLAHRGLVRHAPENTLPGFAAAIELGLSIELDVYQTRDEHLVIIHDATVDRTTNGTGEVVNMTLAEIRKLDAGSWFDPRFTGEKVPTLEEVFQLHSRASANAVDHWTEYVKSSRRGLNKTSCSSSKNMTCSISSSLSVSPSDSTRRFKEANLKLRTTTQHIRNTEQFDADLQDPLANDLWVVFVPDAKAVEQARQLGKRVWISLHIAENQPDTWDKARVSKVDGICTDWPLECCLHWRFAEKPSRQ